MLLKPRRSHEIIFRELVLLKVRMHDVAAKIDLDPLGIPIQTQGIKPRILAINLNFVQIQQG